MLPWLDAVACTTGNIGLSGRGSQSLILITNVGGERDAAAAGCV